ncbi:putative pentatricopeptide repeat-containing protein At3g15130 [Mangifera indica]|uniref:putative pentatricopeptide repeat-containing protein At3g15130 n=1 Tax=Mangifera indica TaxID=29780 RepID=UPI001CF988D1|nr:putative pentatricopeptide repeat-containing protein At3g15130 [Mangifera indica]
MSQRNIFSRAVMIVGSTENEFFLNGFKYFYQMLSYGVLPDTFAYSAIIQTSIGLECIELGRMVHAQIVIRGFHSLTFVATSLLNMYAKLRSIEDSANTYTIISLSKGVGRLGDIDKGKQVQSVAVELGMESDVQVGTTLIDLYSKCAFLQEARAFFNSNIVNFQVNMSWNVMISGYSQNGCSQEALELYFGKEVHGMVLKSGCDMMVISSCNAIADAYAKCGALEHLKKIFNRMEERDMVSWTTLVTAHSQCSEWEEALAIFSQITEEGLRSNQFTFSSVLSLLVDMVAKCGSVSEAEKVFKRIFNPDTVSWTTMILGDADRNLKSETSELLGSHCPQCNRSRNLHGGLVEQGLKYFQEMEQNYGVVPEIEYYACIVDLFGRLNDAMEFIRKMPIEPSEMVWQTLLGTCRVHELGEIAA